MGSKAAELRRFFLGVLVTSLCATAAIAVLALLAGEFGDTAGRILATTGFVSFFSLLALPGGMLLDRGRLRTLAVIELGAAATGFALAMNLVWLAWDDAGEASWKSLVVATVVAGGLAQSAGVELRRRHGDSRRVIRIAVASHVSVAVLAALACAATIREIDATGFYRVLGTAAVINVLLVVLQPILRKIDVVPRDSRSGEHRFVCIVSAPPTSLPHARYTRRPDRPEAVACRVPGRDFAAAAAAAIRELERDGGRVLRLERET